MKSYLPIILITIVFFANSTICYGQLSETNKLLIKARSLQGHNSVRNKVSQDIYNNLIAKEPTNAVFYVESGFFNLNHADKELGMADLNMAMYLLENRVCTCDSEQIIASNYDSEKKIFVCSIELLEKIYRGKRHQFDQDKKLDSSSIYINKLIRLYTDSSGTKPNFSKFENNETAIYKLNELYEDQAKNFGGLNHYRDALHSYRKMITDASSLERNLKYIDLYTIIGEYDSVLQIMNREIFIKTDSGFHFKGGYYFKSPKYYMDYVTAYIAKRDFENALKLLTNNTTIEKNPNSKEAKKKFLMKIFPMYQEGESDNMSERFNRYKEEYSYFNFYSSLLNDLTNKNYEMALLQLNDFYKTREPSFYKLDGREVKYLNGDIFQFEFIIFSLKGYILSKLNKKDEAKLAYQKALKSNPECREALDELKALN